MRQAAARSPASGKQAGSALKRNVAAQTISTSATTRAIGRPRVGIATRIVLAASSSAAIKLSLMISAISTTGSGKIAVIANAMASRRRPARTAQTTSPANADQYRPSWIASIGAGPWAIGKSRRHSHSIAGGCQSSKSPLSAWPYWRIESQVISPGA